MNYKIISTDTITIIIKDALSKTSEAKVQKLIDITNSGRVSSFGFHESAGKFVYHRQNFSAFLEGRDFDIVPVTAEVVPSILCNFRCFFCTYSQNGNKDAFKMQQSRKNGLMSPEIFNKVISSLKELGTRSVIVTGGGEPSVNPEYINYMKHLRSVGLDFGLYSNGYAIANDILEILWTNPTFIRLSLNAGDNDTHKTIHRVENGFQRVVNNIINVGKAKKMLGNNNQTTVGVGFIMGTVNSSDRQLDAIAETLLRIANEAEGGIDYATFRPMVQYFDKDENGQPVICVRQPDQEFFAGLPARIRERIVSRLQGKMNITVAEDGFQHLTQPYQDGKNIASPWSISVNYDGSSYMASEGNGNNTYRFSSQPRNIVKDWHGEKKIDIQSRLASFPEEQNHIKMFPHYKFLIVNMFLQKIREACGIFSPEEVNRFYELFVAKPPRHVNFI